MFSFSKQEKRRAERAEQQRIRTEKDKERQARREVCITDPADLVVNSFPKNKKQIHDRWRLFYPTLLTKLTKSRKCPSSMKTLTLITPTGGEAKERGGRCQEEGRGRRQEEVSSVWYGLQLQQPSAEGQLYFKHLKSTKEHELKQLWLKPDILLSFRPMPRKVARNKQRERRKKDPGW